MHIQPSPLGSEAKPRVFPSTFPFGEGGPLAVDEVESDQSETEDVAQTVGTGETGLLA